MSRGLDERLRNPAPWLGSQDPPRYSGRGRRPTKNAGSRRFGVLDAAVVAIVVFAVWVQTPVGAVVDRFIATATGAPTDGLPPLTAYFDTGDGDADALVEVLAAPPTLAANTPPGALPEPYRTAVQMVLKDGVPRGARQALATAQATNPDATLMDVIDALFIDDPEAALELLIISPEQRDRAIARARAAGAQTPARWQAHRTYLPMRDRLAGDRVVGKVLGLATALDLTWPVAGPHRVSSPWGHRHHPVLKKRKFHNGIDLAVPIGTPILAAQAGVVRTGEDGVSGRYVVIDHGHGVRTSYCHLDSIGVFDGDRVTPGQQIAFSGNTGRSTGPHLHFVVRVGRTTTDPARLRRTQASARLDHSAGSTMGASPVMDTATAP
ncbi:MAG: M23 family metallopeptidase [Myxococcota bacterium]